MNKPFLFTLVILTYNRPERVQIHLEYLDKIAIENLEVIFVDNCSETHVSELMSGYPYIVIRNEENLGAVGRNKGIEAAQGEIIITLDDDVYGITNKDLEHIQDIMQQSDIAAVNFCIREEGTERIANWCHPFDEDFFVCQNFETNSISEGAVALRRSALAQVGLYPEYFFISHEGPDLAMRLINAGWRLVYSPEIVVTHAYEQRGRKSWRRYYYDTRNQLWFVSRNCSFFYGLKLLFISWGSMFIYSIRDGYLRYWFKAVWDALRGVRRALQDRTPPTSAARKKWHQLERQKPSFWKMARKRLFNRGEVKI